VAASDPEIMAAYATLVEDAAAGSRILSTITAELERTTRMLEQIYGGPLAERRPNIHVSLEMRKGALRVLHRQQISLLREWRPIRAKGDAAGAGALLPPLLLTVNAIASGLGATG
jgi:phosphoenolpyruvate carboxylase